MRMYAAHNICSAKSLWDLTWLDEFYNAFRAHLLSVRSWIGQPSDLVDAISDQDLVFGYERRRFPDVTQYLLRDGMRRLLKVLHRMYCRLLNVLHSSRTWHYCRSLQWKCRYCSWLHRFSQAHIARKTSEGWAMGRESREVKNEVVASSLSTRSSETHPASAANSLKNVRRGTTGVLSRKMTGSNKQNVTKIFTQNKTRTTLRRFRHCGNPGAWWTPCDPKRCFCFLPLQKVPLKGKKKKTRKHWFPYSS